jgi:hypothetical protein
MSRRGRQFSFTIARFGLICLFSVVIVCSASYALDPEIGQPFPLGRLGLPSVRPISAFFLFRASETARHLVSFRRNGFLRFRSVVGGCFSIVVVNEEGSEHTCE